MDPSDGLVNTLLVLVISGDVMLILALTKLLPWRTACAFSSVGSLASTITAVAFGAWVTAGIFAASTSLAAYYWWKHRNDDDTGRRRRRVTSKLKSWLPKPKAFARPVPAQS